MLTSQLGRSANGMPRTNRNKNWREGRHDEEYPTPSDASGLYLLYIVSFFSIGLGGGSARQVLIDVASNLATAI
jgi:hypothetical protein